VPPRFPLLAASLTLIALSLPSAVHAGGLTVRLGLGPGYAAGSHDVDGAAASGGGIAVNTELAIGTVLRPGLIVGGGTFPMVVPSPTYADQDAGGHHISATGPFVDYYPRPPHGLHVEGGLLFVAGYHEAQMSHASAIGIGPRAAISSSVSPGTCSSTRHAPAFTTNVPHGKTESCRACTARSVR